MNEPTPDIRPLPYKHRRKTFRLLFLLFIGILPFLYLYATGYRVEFGKEQALVSTGGIYVSADKTNASIYVDEELVRETRTFRRAFYAQGLEPRTHRIHVQKEDSYTWVKELPVYPHMVTEAQSFNLLEVPRVRIISPWRDAAGATVLVSSSTLDAVLVNDIDMIASTTATSTLIADTEFATLALLFATTSATSTGTIVERVVEQFDTIFSATTTASTSMHTATSAKEQRGVKLYQEGDDVFASWVGAREDMPYYYCTDEFELLGTSTPLELRNTSLPFEATIIGSKADAVLAGDNLIGPVQYIPDDAVCKPVIRIDRKLQTVRSFDFYPGSTDLVLLALDDGVYVVEIDNRAWQNVQLLMGGEGLDMRVENGAIYVYDEELIYHVLTEN